MRILVLNWRDITHEGAGGAEVYIHQLARRWVASGQEVRLLCSDVAGRPKTEAIDGVEIFRAGSRFGVYREARRSAQTDMAGWADVVVDCVNTRPFGMPGAVPQPVVGLVHQVCREVWFDEFPWPVAAVGRWILEPWWLRKYRDVPVLVSSESTRFSLARYGLRQVTVVPVGAELSATDARKESRPTVIFVGRLVANKRPSHVLRAFSELRWRLPDAQLWIVGSGSLKADLERQAPDGVTFFGRVDEHEKACLLARAHVLVSTSRREGWGLGVTEAASVGTPAVCYDIAGLRDSVAATGIGRLSPPTPGALAAELAAVLTSSRIYEPVPAPSWDEAANVFLERLEAVLVQNRH